MHRGSVAAFAAIALLLSLGPLARPAHAGWADAIKKKVTEKAGKKAGEATKKADAAADQALDGKEPAAGEAGSPASAGGTAAGASAGNGKVSSVSTKFDFVPGDSVIFLDDFTQDELGEFPAKWRLVQGTFDVAEMEGERWLRSTAYHSHVRMKVPATLPEFWTLEFDFHGVDVGGQAGLEVTGLAAGGSTAWQLQFPVSGEFVTFTNGSFRAQTPFEGTVSGRHHVMFMARGRMLKVYVDRQRVANVPELTGDAAREIDFRIGAHQKAPMITGVRFAAGCRPPQDMLAAGKLVTYGILFATGSDVVMPESAPVLRQVAAYMEQNPAVKLRIVGHTDDVGSTASNLDLSQRRAASVARVLATQFAIAADRFAAEGKGDTQGVASNAKPEGRAMNRRVEFAKL